MTFIDELKSKLIVLRETYPRTPKPERWLLPYSQNFPEYPSIPSWRKTWRGVTHSHLRLHLSRQEADAHVNFLIRDEIACEPMMTIDLERVDTYTAVSITGHVRVGEKKKRGRKEDRNFKYLDGSLTNSAISRLRHYFPSPEIEAFTALWNKWHLNGYRPGTRRQLECVEYSPSVLGLSERAPAMLEERGLLDDRGYVFASGSLVEIAPTDVLTELWQRCVALGGKEPA